MHGGAPHLVSCVDSGAKRVNRPIASAEKLSMCVGSDGEQSNLAGGRRAGDVLEKPVGWLTLFERMEIQTEITISNCEAAITKNTPDELGPR